VSGAASAVESSFATLHPWQSYFLYDTYDVNRRNQTPFTMAECAKRHGHDPEAWPAEVLERLPAMTNRDDLSVMLPSNWQPATAANKPLRETCPT
jgi:hypothetical protein